MIGNMYANTSFGRGVLPPKKTVQTSIASAAVLFGVRYEGARLSFPRELHHQLAEVLSLQQSDEGGDTLRQNMSYSLAF
jgi:hypothetical protein